MGSVNEMCCCYLPYDIIFHLLLLLPVRSLLRFKSVCKSWRSIITDRQFIATHKNQTSFLENTVLVVVRDDRELVNNLYLVNTPTITKELVAKTQVHLPPQFDGEIRFVDHCNGLVCLSNEPGNVIYLWNPSTNQYKVLPSPKIPKIKCSTRLGFGFDSTSDDYKVFSFGLLRVVEDGRCTCVARAEMYSASADSWVEIEVPTTLKSCSVRYLQRSHIKIGGVLYFEGSADIMWFDFHHEAFGVVKFPNSMRSCRNSSIFDFRGSVAKIFKSVGNGDGSVHSLWALLDDGCGKVSWTKKFDLAPDLDFYRTRIFYFLGSGHFVTLNGVRECIFFDYYEKKQIKVRLQVAKAVKRQHTSTFLQTKDVSCQVRRESCFTRRV